MDNILFHIKTKLVLFLVMSAIFLGSVTAFGYVMPAEQILDFMVKNFSGFKSITLIQSTLQTIDGNEKVFTEQLWLEAPDKYSTKALDRLSERDVFTPDILYRQLFMPGEREKIDRILLSLGIDLTKTSYTRVDGVISYRIGGKEPDSPKLIIEKKRFLPLLLTYRVPGKPDGELITVRFDDYQRQDKGWYPFEITYQQGENLSEKYTVQTIEINIPIDASILKTFPEYELPGLNPDAVDSENPDIDKKQLKNVIKAFEEEYQ